MFRSHYCSRCVLVGAFIFLVASIAIAQDDPFGEVAPGGTEGAADPAAAQAEEKSVVAGNVPGGKPSNDQDPHNHTHAHDFCRCVGESDSAAVARIEKVLNSPLRSNGLDFLDAPLEEVVNVLQEEYGIPIQLDVPALEATGLNPSEKVTAKLHNISLRSALRLMLKRLQLTFMIEDEVLLITTSEQAESRLVACVYDVRGIVATTSYDELSDTIVSCVSTESWAENGGGEAEIRPLQPGLLVVSQTQDVHEQINSLLKTIRDMRGNEAEGVAGRGAEDVVTRLYALQVNGNVEKLGNQVREMIIQSIPDAQWDGRLPDGQSVTLTVLADRIIVRQKPAVQEKVAALLKDSGVAVPARAGEFNRRVGPTGPAVDVPKKSNSNNQGGFFVPPVHEPRVSG